METRTLKFAFSDMTNRQIEFFEDYTGVHLAALGEMMESQDFPYKVVTAMTFIALCKVRPDATIDDVLDAKPGDFVLEIETEDDDDPKGSDA